jgi:hypothetical protein
MEQDPSLIISTESHSQFHSHSIGEQRKQVGYHIQAFSYDWARKSAGGLWTTSAHPCGSHGVTCATVICEVFTQRDLTRLSDGMTGLLREAWCSALPRVQPIIIRGFQIPIIFSGKNGHFSQGYFQNNVWRDMLFLPFGQFCMELHLDFGRKSGQPYLIMIAKV